MQTETTHDETAQATLAPKRTEGARRGQRQRDAVHLYLDMVIGTAVVLLISFNFTGLLLHEWLGLAFVPAAILHLLLNRQWITATTRRFFGKLSGRVRFSYLLNAALFVTMTLVTVSGVLISEVTLGSIMPIGSNRQFWRILHSASSATTFVIFIMHVAVHWKWIVNTIRKQLPRLWQRCERRADAPIA